MIALGLCLILLGVFSIIDGVLDFAIRLGCGLAILVVIFGVIGVVLDFLF